MEKISAVSEVKGIKVTTTIEYDISKTEDKEVQDMMEAHNFAIVNLAVVLHLIQTKYGNNQSDRLLSGISDGSFDIFKEEDDFFK